MSMFNSSTNGNHSLHLVKWAALSIGVMIVLSYAVGFMKHHAPAVVRSAPAMALSHATAPAAPAHASTLVLPAGPITLPAQPAPAGLARGHAQIALASAPSLQSQWTSLGSAIIASQTASFETVVPPSLSAVAPSAGLMRLRWHGWIRAKAAGTYVLAARIDGGPVESLALRLDGIASPVLTMQRSCGLWGQCPSAPTTAAGSVALAAGWHEIAATITSYVGSKADATLYMRAPGSATPSVLVPAWPVAAGKGGAK
ncbi:MULTISPECIES: hypothetical protein [Metallibacterium]|jgi:hypothetical protein|uniref:hypothetical protein n=1 Tax=Metallibacterium TaxID=1218803 RepID=UPI00260EF6B6|nr:MULTISPECIES: hypothetical protein [Metallibacterium]MBW8075266.1 hypothetical protein [Metallibacterium scheffleri]